MTTRPAFGDFLTAARDHAIAAVAGHRSDRSGEHVQEVSDSLSHVIIAMSRYLRDIAAGYDGSDWPHHDGLKWPHLLAVAGAGMVVSA